MKSVVKSDKMNAYDYNYCQKLLNEYFDAPMTKLLRAPVDPVKDQCPNYLNIVKEPMDFGTMKKKLKANQYDSIDSFYNDIALICKNAKLFNGETSMFGLIANDIMAKADQWKAEKCSCIEEEWFATVKKGAKELADHLKDAPATVSFTDPLDLPEGFSVDSLSEENKETIATIIKPFKVETLVEQWPFIKNELRLQVLDIVAPPPKPAEKPPPKSK